MSVFSLVNQPFFKFRAASAAFELSLQAATQISGE